MKKIQTPVIPCDLQKNITEKLETLDHIIEAQEVYKVKLNQLKSGFMGLSQMLI